MTRQRTAASVVVSPASLKGVLDPFSAAAALAAGIRSEGVDAVEAPVADGGEATARVLYDSLGGRWFEEPVHDALERPVTASWLLLPNGTAVIEAASALGLPRIEPELRDPLRSTSRGFGELVAAALRRQPRDLLLCLGGVATVDGGRGLRQVVGSLPPGTTVACDVRSPLLGRHGAARAFGPQKGASEADVERLEQTLMQDRKLAPYAALPGAGAAGGLGAALASLGATLAPGSDVVIDRIGLRQRIDRAALVVTGEGTVDETTFLGKAPGRVAALAKELGVPCVLFGGVVECGEAVALSGQPELAARDLTNLGRRLGRIVAGVRRGQPLSR